MEKIVQKFGGTSIGNADRMIAVANIVQKTLENNQFPVVVLSALSSERKNGGTTSRLLEAAQESIKHGPYYKIIDHIQETHIKVVRNAVEVRNLREELEGEIERELHKLKLFLDAIQVIGEISPRSLDVIISTGEKLSARIFTETLNSHGTDASYINLDDVVDKPFYEIDQRFCSYLQKKLAKLVTECGAKIPVVTGFIGFVPHGIIRSIGRGYTDFTAALIATGIRAKELQIWKEVNGIYTADPKKVSTARVLSRITPAEASELTYFGSEVIHPFTMEQVSNANIPVRIKNTFEPDLPGTIIKPLKDAISEKIGPTAVTVKRDIIIIDIQSNRMLMAYGFMSKIFDIFNRYEIVIDLVSTSEVSVSLSLDNTQNLRQAIRDLKHLGSVSIREGMAILSLVGEGMRNSVGTAGKMFSKLAEQGINIEVISQGASEINISCAIEDQQSDKALRAVHEMLVEV
ncbi:MAG: aspartate kinase [SAR324 cluster bacterium]|nr:aspartate kinase [SAR324 cluster bacterium]